MKFHRLFQVIVICIVILPASAIAGQSIYPLNGQNSIFSTTIVNSGFSTGFANQFISPQNVDNGVLLPDFNPVYPGGISNLPIHIPVSQPSIQETASNENPLVPTQEAISGFSNSPVTLFVPALPMNPNPSSPITGFYSSSIGSPITDSQNSLWNGLSASSTGQFPIPNPTVKISRQQAIEIAKRQYGDITLTGSPSASLVTDRNLRQVWEVMMEGYLPGDRFAWVNDKTGEIVGYGQYAIRGGTAYIDAATGEVLSVDYIL